MTASACTHAWREFTHKVRCELGSFHFGPWHLCVECGTVAELKDGRIMRIVEGHWAPEWTRPRADRR